MPATVGRVLLIAVMCVPSAALRAVPLSRAARKPYFARSAIAMCTSPPGERSVRVVVHNAELLSARTGQQQQQTAKKKTGIESVSIGGYEIKFTHDMTSTFKWGGIILGLVLLKAAPSQAVPCHQVAYPRVARHALPPSAPCHAPMPPHPVRTHPTPSGPVPLSHPIRSGATLIAGAPQG